jgi:hypothetical protein
MPPAMVAEQLASRLAHVQVYELARVHCERSPAAANRFTCEAVSVPFKVGGHVQDARTFVHVTVRGRRIVSWQVFGAVA